MCQSLTISLCDDGLYGLVVYCFLHFALLRTLGGSDETSTVLPPLSFVLFPPKLKVGDNEKELIGLCVVDRPVCLPRCLPADLVLAGVGAMADV